MEKLKDNSTSSLEQVAKPPHQKRLRKRNVAERNSDQSNKETTPAPPPLGAAFEKST
jgi:hypothetical protein